MTYISLYRIYKEVIIFFGKIPVVSVENFIKKAKKYQHKYLRHINVRNTGEDTSGDPGMDDSEHDDRKPQHQERKASGEVLPVKADNDDSDNGQGERQAILGPSRPKGGLTVPSKSGPSRAKLRSQPSMYKKEKKYIDPIVMGREVFQ
jgi:hypothetical protein